MLVNFGRSTHTAVFTLDICDKNMVYTWQCGVPLAPIVSSDLCPLSMTLVIPPMKMKIQHDNYHGSKLDLTNIK